MEYQKNWRKQTEIDGCGIMQRLWYVIVPMLKPSIVSCALFQFMWASNDFMGPLIYVNTVAKYPVSIFLRMSMDADVGFEWNESISHVTDRYCSFTDRILYSTGFLCRRNCSRRCKGMRKGRIIDSHAHLVQYIAGTGAGGELRSIGNGMAVYANGQTVRMIPKEFGGDQVTPEHLIQVMDKNGVEKAVLLQGNFYGYQNFYTHLAVKKYPGPVCWSRCL